MNSQQEFVLRTIEERDIRFVRLWFTDILGYLKSVAVVPAELESAFEEGIGFDGSAIEGFSRVSEADTIARPDPSTFQLMPFERQETTDIARMFCDITMPDGQPSYADPRQVLRRQVKEAAIIRRCDTCCALNRCMLPLIGIVRIIEIISVERIFKGNFQIIYGSENRFGKDTRIISYRLTGIAI